MRQGIYQSSALQRRLLGAEPEDPTYHLMIVRIYTEISIIPVSTFVNFSAERGYNKIDKR